MEKENLIFNGVPRDRITLLTICRHFSMYNPIVNSAIMFHSIYPIKKFKIFGIKDIKSIEKLKLIEKCGTEDYFYVPAQRLIDLSKEYWLVGEVFPYVEMKEKIWENFIIQNPNYIYIKRSVFGNKTEVQLRPDTILQKIVESHNPVDMELRKQIPEFVAKCIEDKENIPLSNLNISCIQNLASPFDLRGNSIIFGIIKDLELYDVLREKLFNREASEIDLTYFKDILENIKRGLLIKKECVETLIYRYFTFRNLLEKWLIEKIFVPTGQDSIQICWENINKEELIKKLEAFVE